MAVDILDATTNSNYRKYRATWIIAITPAKRQSRTRKQTILLYNNLSQSSPSKLKIMRKSQDEFYIAGKNMILRDSRDILDIK
ncbi:hypothetical protein [Wolbachia endosymbiont of Onchocerca gibsoni]|uniref:hypothetical protein n=1 Tax=Wolbachia endosymbiont of Onchocerca gibsoni TaxID=118986 RepID=UPI0023D7E42F|nr:hypothetical protein [Wolbachia endosymbiont of Onchocerca gibsoni]